MASAYPQIVEDLRHHAGGEALTLARVHRWMEHRPHLLSPEERTRIALAALGLALPRPLLGGWSFPEA